MIFLPIFFVCTVSGECDFIPLESVSTETECVSVIDKQGERFIIDPVVRRFKSVCIQIDEAILIKKKGNV